MQKYHIFYSHITRQGPLLLWYLIPINPVCDEVMGACMRRMDVSICDGVRGVKIMINYVFYDNDEEVIVLVVRMSVLECQQAVSSRSKAEPW